LVKNRKAYATEALASVRRGSLYAQSLTVIQAGKTIQISSVYINSHSPEL